MASILSEEREGALTTAENTLTVDDCAVRVVETGGIQSPTDPTAGPAGSSCHITAASGASEEVLRLGVRNH